MDKSNSINFTFSKAEDFEDESNLCVNLTLISEYSASEWYPYQKRITIMYNSKLLVHNLNEPNVARTSIEVLNPKQSLHYESDSDNVYANIGVDTFESFKFSSEFYNVSVDIKNGKSPILSRAEYLAGTNLLKLHYYDSNEAKYKIYPLNAEDINYIDDSYTYEQLKNSEKLLEEDIRRLEHLTSEQIQSLILIHRNKDFKLLGGS
ncbi:hypothetical protein [Psychrobacter sp. DAB_AL32B]|uniref:hypothetical protein n=1 Tax=Psychrobacter sp. DAB_AL32B TaxID=1028414 RepID=UPI000F4F3A97|nr:hypothetical protein [Psychrobacter sp. DAB_AL32B]